MLAFKNSKSYVILPSFVYNYQDYFINSCNLLFGLNHQTNIFIVSENFVLLGDFNDINWDSLHGHSPSSAKFCEIVLSSILFN